jgi:hypothetical protein
MAGPKQPDRQGLRPLRRAADACNQASASVTMNVVTGSEPVVKRRAWPDRELLASGRLAGICRVCEQPIQGGEYRTVRMAGGLFCSLTCLAIPWYSPRRADVGEGV